MSSLIANVTSFKVPHVGKVSIHVSSNALGPSDVVCAPVLPVTVGWGAYADSPYKSTDIHETGSTTIQIVCRTFVDVDLFMRSCSHLNFFRSLLYLVPDRAEQETWTGNRTQEKMIIRNELEG